MCLLAVVSELRQNGRAGICPPPNIKLTCYECQIERRLAYIELDPIIRAGPTEVRLGPRATSNCQAPCLGQEHRSRHTPKFLHPGPTATCTHLANKEESHTWSVTLSLGPWPACGPHPTEPSRTGPNSPSSAQRNSSSRVNCRTICSSVETIPKMTDSP